MELRDWKIIRMCPVCKGKLVNDSLTGLPTCQNCDLNQSSHFGVPNEAGFDIAFYHDNQARTSGTRFPQTIVVAEQTTEQLTSNIIFNFYEQIQKMQIEMSELRGDIEELRGNLPQVIVINEITKKEAKRLVEEYFQKNGEADIEELMLNLRIPVNTIIEIIDELKKEKKLIKKE